MKMIYSESLCCMVASGFTTRKVIFDNTGLTSYKIKKGFHWSWNDSDCVYYRDDVDDVYADEPIKNGEKTFVLKVGASARYLVKMD